MQPSHRLLGIIVRGAWRGMPWIGVLAVSTSLAAAMTFAVAGAPPRAPETSGLPLPGVPTAALADGDDVRASFLDGLTVRDGEPIQHDHFASSDHCDSGDGRMLYVGLNSWIVTEPQVTPCADDGS